MLENGLIESIINNVGSIDEITRKLIRQYIGLKVLYKINEESFKDYGSILHYSFDEGLLDEEVRFEVKSCFFDMKYEYIVIRNNEDIFVLEVNSNKENYFGVKADVTIAYIYKNTIYIDGYIEDKAFEEQIEKHKYTLANLVQTKFNKEVYKGIVSLYDSIKDEKFFKEKVNENMQKEQPNILKKDKAEVLKNFINLYHSNEFDFKLENLDKSIYLDVFRGKNKDKILNLLLTKIHEKNYIKCTRSIYEYITKGEAYIDNIIEENKNSLIDLLVKKQAWVSIEEAIIDDSLDILKKYEYMFIYNNKVLSIYETLINTINKIGCKKINISFDGEEAIDISGSIKCNGEGIVIDGIKVNSVIICTNIWSQKSNLVDLISLNNIRDFVIFYKGTEIFRLDKATIDFLKQIAKAIL